MADASEQLFDAMSILIEKKLETVKFDETIQATVTDASKADTGEYTVSTGNAKFKAYSTETRYKENDAVLVTIPQGNYDNQKIIAGKQVDDMNTPMIYTSPFESIVNITNNIIPGEHSWTYYANGDDWGWNIGRKSMSLPEDESKYIVIDGLYKGYNVIGIKAQFSTWLAEYNTVQGNYGLLAELTFRNDAAASEDRNTFTTTVVFDSDNFFGDVYNFETYYTQEIVFDLSEYSDYTVTKVKLAPYQRNNFKARDGSVIKAPDGNNFSTIKPNIFIKDPYICFGNYIKDFNKDTAEIVSINSANTYYKQRSENNTTIDDRTIFRGTQEILLTGSIAEQTDPSESAVIDYAKPKLLYLANENNITAERHNNIWTVTYNCYRRPYENKKNIVLRWIHKDTATGTIATVEDKTFPTDYTVRWYKYQLGAKSPDEFAGAHWVHFYGCTSTADKNGNWVITQYNVDTDVTTDELQVLFQPNVNLQNEKVKAIVLKKEEGEQGEEVFRFIAASNVLEFTNDTDVRSQPTIIDSNALSIKYEDDERGHYFIYDEGGDVGTNEDKEVRKLTAVFDTGTNIVDEKALLQVDECTSVIWTFPNEADGPTMIIPMDSDEPGASPSSTHIIGDANGNVKRQSVGFTIKPHLNHAATNNTIQLKIQKDGQEYEASIQPMFGTAGTNGSDYTVILQWKNCKNALNVGVQGDELEGEIAIQDQHGDIQPWPEDAEVQCEWEVAYIQDITEPEQEVTEKGLLYPVLNSGQILDNDTVYYFPPSDSQEIIATYKRYNLDTERFESIPENESYTNYQCYRPAGDEDDSATSNIKKLEFKPVKFTKTPYINDNGELENIEEYPVDGNQRYYSNSRRYFIKHKDQYILDPWQTYLETETYYEPVALKGTKYSAVNGYVSLTMDTSTPGVKTVKIRNVDGNINSIFILKITISNFGDFPLVTYYPVPLKTGETFSGQQKTFCVDFIEGPDRVRYGSSGETDYNKNPYKITTRKWNGSSFEAWRHGYKSDSQNILSGYWSILVSDTDETDNFKPGLKETATGQDGKTKQVINGEYDIPILNPVGVYIPTAAHYAVQFHQQELRLISSQSVFNSSEQVYDAEGTQIQKGEWATNTYYGYTDTIIWTQPILVYQNKYPSRTLNKWNGKDILTDDDTGTITASGFAAGKKESGDNSFTGVVIGDWSRTKADTCITKNTGVYGFYHGAMSYAFKDDGTGFIGKDGRGRIHFDGEKSQIYSNNWKGNSPQGMLLDIDDGYIKMQSAQITQTPILNPKSQFATDVKTYKQQTDQDKKVYRKTEDNEFVELENGTKFEADKYYKYSIQTQSIDEEHPLTDQDQSMFTGATVKTYGTGHTYQLKYKDDNNILQSVQPLDTYSSSLMYFRERGASDEKYITIGSNQSLPLSIGTELGVGKREFRVEWDGTTHITNGDFSGTINAISGTLGDLEVTGTLHGGIIRGASIYANYLEVSNGLIGGWSIGGQTLSGGDTTLDSSNGITTNLLTLRDTDTVNNHTVTGKFGIIDGLDEIIKDGVTQTVQTIILGLQSDTSSIALEVPSDKKIRLSGPGSGIRCAGIYLQGHQFQVSCDDGVGITLQQDPNTGIWGFSLNGVDADHQYGIYAKFA